MVWDLEENILVTSIGLGRNRGNLNRRQFYCGDINRKLFRHACAHEITHVYSKQIRSICIQISRRNFNVNASFPCVDKNAVIDVMSVPLISSTVTLYVTFAHGLHQIQWTETHPNSSPHTLLFHSVPRHLLSDTSSA